MNSLKNVLIMGLISSPIFFLYIYVYSVQTRISLSDSVILLLPHLLILLLILISSWYICVATPLHMKNITNLVIRHTGGAVSITVIWILIGKIYSDLLASFIENELWKMQYSKSIPLLIITALVIYIIISNINYIIIAFERSRKAEEKALQNSLLARESELQSLKSTIHPHFLFNSLTALSSLTLEDPQSAHRLTNRISDFLRYTLRFYKKEKVTVLEEINHLNNYLEIEKLRLGDRLKIELHSEPDSDKLYIMPLILMPLAENAIKHGISNMISGGTLSIDISHRSGYIQIQVKNPFEPGAKNNTGEKKGLTILQQRLNTRYLKQANMNIKKTENEFTVNLSIPVDHENN